MSETGKPEFSRRSNLWQIAALGKSQTLDIASNSSFKLQVVLELKLGCVVYQVLHIIQSPVSFSSVIHSF